MIDWAAYALLSGRALASLRARYGSDEEAARRFGPRLGWLLVTLRLGDPASRAARPDWDESYWRHWAGIRTVFLGGGIVSGEIGSLIVKHAARTLAEAGMADCRVQVAPWPRHLPLVGAARSVTDASTVPVLDFGQTFVKRGHALYEDGRLTALQLLPHVPATLGEFPPGTEPTDAEIRRLADEIVSTLVTTCRQVHEVTETAPTIIVASVAAYMRDGQPMIRKGGAYSYLLDLSDNLAAWLSEQVSRALHRPITVRLLHDGTAAGLAMAGEPHAAVIMLGTALGVGFPPESAPGCQLAPGFVVREGRLT
jgi:hypothetical protein